MTSYAAASALGRVATAIGLTGLYTQIIWNPVLRKLPQVGASDDGGRSQGESAYSGSHAGGSPATKLGQGSP